MINNFMSRNYSASKWVAYQNNPKRYCDYCMDLLDNGKCTNGNCPKYDHFLGCDWPGDECVCQKIEADRQDDAGDKASEMEIDENRENKL